MTNHKPVLGILLEKRGISQSAASRLQRWVTILSTYNYILKYKTGTSNSNVDCLSRFPKDYENDFVKLENLVFLTDLVESPITYLIEPKSEETNLGSSGGGGESNVFRRSKR